MRIWQILSLVLVVQLAGAACHGRQRVIGPEMLILESAQNTATIVDQGFTGNITCSTCDSGNSVMTIDVNALESFSTSSLATVTYDHLGQYMFRVRVPHGELISIDVTIFTNGGVRKIYKEVRVEKDKSIERANYILNMSTDDLN